jgi:hypothetical protein
MFTHFGVHFFKHVAPDEQRENYLCIRIIGQSTDSLNTKERVTLARSPPQIAQKT